MKFFVVFAALLSAVAAAEEHCFKTISGACDSGIVATTPSLNCNATYGGMTNAGLVIELQKFTNLHFIRSFEYLLVSTHFGNYINNRKGFEKVFRKLSDQTWEAGIDLIKHITKRGQVHTFIQRPSTNHSVEHLTFVNQNLEHHELGALSRAADVQKHLAKQAFDIHKLALHKHDHDAEIAQYIEEEFAEKHADEVRTLVGHVNDLRRMTNSVDGSLALHLFDEYLEKA